MPTAATLARNMEASEAGEDFVAGSACGDVGAGVKSRESVDERGLVDCRLTFAEGVGGVFQDASEVLFGFGAKANPPVRLGHLTFEPEIAALPSRSR
jgi:hypothetical protein